MDNYAKSLAEKMKRIHIKPEDLFRNDDLYSDYDSLGIPTKDALGIEISKSMTKKMQKEWEKQKKLYDSNFLDK
jgi:hypothetical protein